MLESDTSSESGDTEESDDEPELPMTEDPAKMNKESAGLTGDRKADDDTPTVETDQPKVPTVNKSITQDQETPILPDDKETETPRTLFPGTESNKSLASDPDGSQDVPEADLNNQGNKSGGPVETALDERVKRNVRTDTSIDEANTSEEARKLETSLVADNFDMIELNMPATPEFAELSFRTPPTSPQADTGHHKEDLTDAILETKDEETAPTSPQADTDHHKEDLTDAILETKERVPTSPQADTGLDKESPSYAIAKTKDGETVSTSPQVDTECHEESVLSTKDEDQTPRNKMQLEADTGIDSESKDEPKGALILKTEDKVYILQDEPLDLRKELNIEMPKAKKELKKVKQL